MEALQDYGKYLIYTLIKTLSHLFQIRVKLEIGEEVLLTFWKNKIYSKHTTNNGNKTL